MNHYLWELRPYFRQTVGQLALGSLAGIVMNTAVVLPALALGHAIDVVTQFTQGETTLAAVAQTLALFLAATLATELPRVGKRWWLMTANARIRANLRADAMRGVLAWPMAQFIVTPIGDIMARIVGDVETLGVGVREFIIETWDTVLFLASFLVAMLVLDAPLTLLALSPVPVAMLLAWAAGRWVRGRTAVVRRANSALTAGLQELLSGIRVVRLLGMRDAAQHRVERLADEQARANLAAAQLRTGLPPIYTTLMAAGVVLVIWLAGNRVVSGAWTLGGFVAFLDLFTRFTGRGFRVPQLVNSIQAGGAAYERLQPLLAPPVSTSREPRFASFRANRMASLPVDLSDTAWPGGARMTNALSLSLRDVTFAYRDSAPALRNVSLDIPAGAFVAVTGPVGSGKSALARALLGLYPLVGGCVTIDGDAPSAHSSEIGYLPQEPFLFSGTVRDNIAIGRALADTDAQRSVALAALERDVSGFPNGLTTEIGERGIRISGGQRQRIALARAVAQAPKLLVLDDPFSSVDVYTEAQIITGIRAAYGPSAPLHQRATTVLCSHRLAAFPLADVIVVLDHGRIVEQGTHAELMSANGMYARIFAAQAALAKATSA